MPLMESQGWHPDSEYGVKGDCQEFTSQPVEGQVGRRMSPWLNGARKNNH